MTLGRRPRGHAQRTFRAALAMVAVLLWLAAPVGAHSSLITTSPTPGQTVGGTLEAIDLVFDAGVEDVEVTLEAPDGEFLEVAIDQLADNWLQLMIDTPTIDGQYIVRFSFISEDGDPVESAYAFSYEQSAPEAIPVPRSTAAEVSTDGGLGAFTAVTALLGIGVLVLVILLGVRLRELRLARAVAESRP